MQNSYIVRNDCERLRAGDLVLQVAQPGVSGNVVVCTSDNPMQGHTVEKCDLLRRERYLKVQPLYNYWYLQRRATPECPAVYVSDAATDEFGGDEPFHFESFGEIVFYLRERTLLSNRFYIGQRRYLPNLVTLVNPKKFKNATTT